MILHDTAVDYYGVFELASAADDAGLDVVSVNHDPGDKQWHILVRPEVGAYAGVTEARRAWETAVEKRRMKKS